MEPTGIRMLAYAVNIDEIRVFLSEHTGTVISMND